MPMLLAALVTVMRVAARFEILRLYVGTNMIEQPHHQYDRVGRKLPTNARCGVLVT